MLIELIGPAGSGKTSLAKSAEALLRKAGVDVLGFGELERLESEIGIRSFRGDSRASRWRVIAGLLLRCPDIIVPILLLSWLYGPEQSTGLRKRRRRHTRRVIGHVRIALALRRTAGDRVVLLHEGFTQVMWSFLTDSPSLKAIWLIRFALSRYHATFRQHGVCLGIDDDTVMERVFSRDHKGRFNRKSSDALRQAFPAFMDDHRALVDMLPSGLIIAKIDGSTTSERMARDLVAVIDGQGTITAQQTAVAVGTATV